MSLVVELQSALRGSGSGSGTRGSVASSSNASGAALTAVSLKDLQRSVPSKTDVISPQIRGLAWRVFLNVLPFDKPLESWRATLDQQKLDYYKMKEETMPSLVKVQADPLSGLAASDGGATDEWTAYYKNLELSNFINGDLDRLYMTGVEDNYFQSTFRRSLLLSVLLLWALRHKKTSYRQGMHEIAAPLLYVLETELAAFSSSKAPEDQKAFDFTESSLEAHTFVLFERIMDDLEILYDPTPSPRSPDKQPEIVAFCSNIQEQRLKRLDPQLCAHLEDSYVQAQLYGMRWSRLMFGREFPLNHSQSLRVWDFLFVSCLGSSSDNVTDTGYSPLLGAIGDFILSMLLFIRNDLVCEDPNVTIGLLMHYPQVESVASILEMSGMVKSGKIAAASSTVGASSSTSSSTSTSTSSSTSSISSSGDSRKQAAKSGSPAWLRFLEEEKASSSSSPTKSSLTQVSDGINRLGEGISQLGGAVGSVLGSTTRIFTSSSSSGASLPATVSSPFDPTSPVGKESPQSSSHNSPDRDPFGNTVAIATDVPSLPIAPTTTTPASLQQPSTPAAASPPAQAPAAIALTAVTSPAPQSQPQHQPQSVQTQAARNEVSDRLYLLSAALSKPPSITSSEESLRLEAAQRVRMLANVLSGLADLGEYDQAFK